jgi:Zn-dependent metalloprotease
MNVWRILFIICLILLISAGGVYFIIQFQKHSEAASDNIIQTDNLSQQSDLEKTNNTIFFDLYTDDTNTSAVSKGDDAIFETKTTNDGAILEFIKRSPQYDPNQLEDKLSSDKNVKGIFFTTSAATKESLIPANFEARLIRRVDDKTNKKFDGIDINTGDNKIHHYYEQKINDIPVYGAILAVHVKDGNKIYSASGSLVTNTVVGSANFTKEEAEQTALLKAQQDTQGNIPFTISRSVEYIFNKKVMGIDDEDKNYLTQVVTVVPQDRNIPFAMMYFVDLESGGIVYSESLLRDVLNRDIYNCSGGSCVAARKEGTAENSNQDVNKVYDYLGDTYNLYSTMFNRDSYDGAGATLKGFANQPSSSQFRCPNAAWFGSRNGGDDTMRVCQGMAAKDVMAHEMTHAVTERTAALQYQNQSGALNEAMSDIFGYGVDSDDWTMGEDSALGIIRRFDDPTQGLRPQPDRLFASQYECTTVDSGGVHINSGIINKAFYLMTAGGTFNGCTVNGVTKEKSLAVAYKALTTYLRPTSNFKAAYNAFNQACTDLYATDGETCNEIRKAMQAVEIDQQPDNDQKSPKCTSKTAVPATCASGAQNPTMPATSVTPGTTTISPTRTVTATPTINVTVTPGPSATPTTVPPNATLKLSVKFQGITTKPVASGSATIKVTVVNDTGYKYATAAQFAVGDNGIWTSSVPIAIPAAGAYSVFVKGPYHIQKKVCDTNPTETAPGTYRCKSDQKLQLKTGENVLDFSGIVLLSGDLGEQDGVVNAADVALIRNNLGSTNADILKQADVNRDGIIDTQDHSLVIAALSFRFDEE